MKSEDKLSICNKIFKELIDLINKDEEHIRSILSNKERFVINKKVSEKEMDILRDTEWGFYSMCLHVCNGYEGEFNSLKEMDFTPYYEMCNGGYGCFAVNIKRKYGKYVFKVCCSYSCNDNSVELSISNTEHRDLVFIKK